MRLTEMSVLVPVDEHGEPDIDGLLARLRFDPNHALPVAVGADCRTTHYACRCVMEQLEKAEAEVERLRAEVERLRGALNISPDDVGRIMHESWSRTKRSQGFHHPSECPNGQWVETARGRAPCPKCHADLIPWDNLPEPQKDINRHAFDDVLAEIRRRAALAERGGESG